MSSGKPIIKQIKFISIVIHLIVIFLISFIYFLFGSAQYIINGCLTYVVLTLAVRETVAKNHRRGIRFYKKGLYEQALAEFQKSLIFFKNINGLTNIG